MEIKNKIICPHCGAEYIPSEIFYPGDFLESDVNILKDANGRIERLKCADAELIETYTCDCCNKDFTVKAHVSYEVDASEDFDADFVIEVL